MEARIPEGEPLFMATAELMDWSKGDTDEIYAFKVVRAARYEALEAAANEVLRVYMPQFESSLTVDDCLVRLAAAVAGVATASGGTDAPDSTG